VLLIVVVSCEDPCDASVVIATGLSIVDIKSSG